MFEKIARSTSRIGQRLAAGVDRGFVRLAFRDGRPGSPQDSQQRDADPSRADDGSDARSSAREAASAIGPRELEAMGERFVELDEAGELFPSIDAPPRLTLVPSARRRWAHVSDVTWPSDYRPHYGAYRRALGRCPETMTCHARWFSPRERDRRTAVLCLHGWGAGQFGLEERAFPVRWMVSTLGLDVLLVTLPFHAHRRSQRGRTPAFPSSNPMRANEGFAHAVHDLRALIAALTEDFGFASVGVMGMSLGGYTSALLATVEPHLRFAAPLIPFASLPGLMWEHGEHTASRSRAEARGIERAHFESAFEAITPTRRAAAIPGEHVFVAAGRHDRVTPPEHAHMLHRHFEGSALVTYPGAHLLQLGRGKMFRELGRFLNRCGVL